MERRKDNMVPMIPAHEFFLLNQIKWINIERT